MRKLWSKQTIQINEKKNRGFTLSIVQAARPEQSKS